MMVEIINGGDLSIKVGGKMQGLTKENAISKLTGADGQTLDHTDKHTFEFFAEMTRRKLFNAFQQKQPNPELIEAVYNAAMQSALDVLIEQRSPKAENNAILLEDNGLSDIG